MSAFPDRAMVEQAIAWHLRLNDGDEAAWVEFAEWLSADPAHNSVYEAVADADERMLPLLAGATFPSGGDQEAVPEFSNDDDAVADPAGEGALRAKPWRWGALAATVAVAGLFGVQLLPSADASYSIGTAAGETRTVALEDGSEIRLNGSTTIILEKDDSRSVELARGEARFTVEHDAGDPFTVVVGEQRLVDIGTVFNVVRTNRRLRVGVVEGAVRYEGAAHTINLRAGDMLATDHQGKIDLARSPVVAIGSWAMGRLVYDQAPLEQVAEDLYRSIGISLELPRQMQARRFSGVIQTEGDSDAVRARLEELIGETIVAHGARWSVDPR